MLRSWLYLSGARPDVARASLPSASACWRDRGHRVRANRRARPPGRGHPGRRQVAAAGDRGGTVDFNRDHRPGLLGGAAGQFASASRGGVRRPDLACSARPFPLAPGGGQHAGPEPRPGRTITTYQGVAAAPDLHLREFKQHRTLLVVDEVHHLPALAETDPDTASEAAKSGEDLASAWSRAILPLLECASVRLLLSGTLERATGAGSCGCPTARDRRRKRARSRWTLRAGP